MLGPNVDRLLRRSHSVLPGLWVPPEANPESRIYVHVVYPGPW